MAGQKVWTFFSLDVFFITSIPVIGQNPYGASAGRA